jgi:hypothetical protein
MNEDLDALYRTARATPAQLEVWNEDGCHEFQEFTSTVVLRVHLQPGLKMYGMYLKRFRNPSLGRFDYFVYTFNVTPCCEVQSMPHPSNMNATEGNYECPLWEFHEVLQQRRPRPVQLPDSGEHKKD